MNLFYILNVFIFLDVIRHDKYIPFSLQVQYIKFYLYQYLIEGHNSLGRILFISSHAPLFTLNKDGVCLTLKYNNN
jgi:hypothetical protein